MIPAGLRKILAFGSGLGIEIAGPRGGESLEIAAVRVRPGGAKVLGGLRVEDFPHQAAGVVGTDIAAFAKKLGLGHVVATVLLPRQDVIIRTLALPGVSDKDMAAAVGFQLDGLHPYAEEDVISSWSRLPDSSTVLVALARRDAIERYATFFAEAGIKVGAFTCSAAAIHSALRLFGTSPALPLVAVDASDAGVEVYGESASRPLYSSRANLSPERALAIAYSELRLESPMEATAFSALVGAEQPLPVAAALASACPRHVLDLNLLPEDQRVSGSLLIWVPSAVLGALILLLAGGLAALPAIEQRRYADSLQQEISRVEPAANRAAALDKQIDAVRKRTDQLDGLRRRPKADMDALQEMTRVIPPNTWLNLLEVSAKQVVLGGETDQAAPLLKTIDTSPLFQGSEFVGSPVRIQAVERFQIRTNRESTPRQTAQAGGRP
jgi:Tfp pilus assembly protein PilN